MITERTGANGDHPKFEDVQAEKRVRAQFEAERIMSSDIRAQLGKVEVVADPEIEKVFPALQRVIVTIKTCDGREFTKELDYPKGDPRNPLTDEEVEGKFDALAAPILSDEKRRRIKDTVWNLDTLATVSELMDLCKSDA